MADFTVRADHIDVEQIMRQIRARIRDKRGADYTEAEIRELASVKLDKFLDPRAVRSDLLQHYRRERQPAPLITPEEAHPPLYDFNMGTVYVSDRGAAGRVLTIIRKILKPFTKLMFHVDTIWDVLTKQSVINRQHTALFQRVHQRLITRDELDALNFEMFNNLVVEITRLAIENKNLRMQVESFGTRLDFDERRARALEGVVQYKPGAPVARPQPPPGAAPGGAPGADEGDEEDGPEGSGETRSARRRRRRRGRRRGPGDQPGAPGGSEVGGAQGGQPRDAGGDAPGRDSMSTSWTPAPAAEPARERAPEPSAAPERETAEPPRSEQPAYALPDAPQHDAPAAPSYAPPPRAPEPDASASDRPAPTRIFDSPSPSEPGDPESSAS